MTDILETVEVFAQRHRQSQIPTTQTTLGVCQHLEILLKKKAELKIKCCRKKLGSHTPSSVCAVKESAMLNKRLA